MRELECVKFPATPAVLMAIYSDRFGSRGLTLMHFKESLEMARFKDGSSNANFSSDCSPSAALPAVTISCSSYEDILDAIHSLSALAHAKTHVPTARVCGQEQVDRPRQHASRVRFTL